MNNLTGWHLLPCVLLIGLGLSGSPNGCVRSCMWPWQSTICSTWGLAGVAAKYRALGAWRWAAATLLSRTMFVPWDEAGALACMT